MCVQVHIRRVAIIQASRVRMRGECPWTWAPLPVNRQSKRSVSLYFFLLFCLCSISGSDGGIFFRFSSVRSFIYLMRVPHMCNAIEIGLCAFVRDANAMRT